jgi:protein TonB
MKIGVRMRRALFWSLAAHLFVLWLMVKERAIEADTAGSGLAVTIAPSQSKPSLQPPSPALPSPKLMASSRLGNDATIPHIRQQAVAKNVDALTPTVTSAKSPSIISVTSLDAEGVRQYRFALAREMRRAWAYPPQALTHHWEGSAEIRIELLAGGRFAAARIEKSSGHPVLDEAALKIISNAATVAPVPSSLSGEAISIVQPVVFSLRSENHLQDN